MTACIRLLVICMAAKKKKTAKRTVKRAAKKEGNICKYC